MPKLFRQRNRFAHGSSRTAPVAASIVGKAQVKPGVKIGVILLGGSAPLCECGVC
jgi:hypothetical protein